jgi:hypothetical protein
MRVITTAMLATGVAGVLALSAPAETKAQGAYIYGPGVGVEITTRPYRHRHWQHRHHHEPSAAYYYGPSTYGYSGYRRARCEPGYTWQNGSCRP